MPIKILKEHIVENDNEFILAKLALIESLLRDLWVEWLERLQEPMTAAERRSEGYDKGNTGLEDPSLPQSLALLQQEFSRQFFDDVIAELRRRVEIRSQGK